MKKIAFSSTVFIVLLLLCSCQQKITMQIGNNTDGSQLLDAGKNEEAVEYYENLLRQKFTGNGEDNTDVATIYNNLSVAYLNLNNNEKGLEYANKARLISEKQRDEKSLAINYSNMGEAYYYMNDFRPAIECYKKSLEIEQKLYGKGSTNAITTAQAIASAYRELGEYEEAFDLLTEIIQIDLQENGEESITVRYSYRNLGKIYMLLNDKENAEKYYNMAIDNNRTLKEPDLKCEADLYEMIGTLYDEDNPEVAIENYNKAMNFYESDDKWLERQAQISYELMNSYKRLGELDSAQKYGIKACTIAEKLGNDTGISEEDKSNYKEKLQEIYNELSDDKEGTNFENWYKQNVMPQ